MHVASEIWGWRLNFWKARPLSLDVDNVLHSCMFRMFRMFRKIATHDLTDSRTIYTIHDSCNMSSSSSESSH